MSTVRLTTTSYVVLGLVEMFGPVTPYDIKQAAEMSVNHFWAVAHTQLYAETSRLAIEGLLDEQQEAAGRRRKAYTITEAGRAALDTWRSATGDTGYELRDPGTLKLFFGADPVTLAEEQLELHGALLAKFDALLVGFGKPTEESRGMRLALECGIGHEREFIRFWSSVRDDSR